MPEEWSPSAPFPCLFQPGMLARMSGVCVFFANYNTFHPCFAPPFFSQVFTPVRVYLLSAKVPTKVSQPSGILQYHNFNVVYLFSQTDRMPFPLPGHCGRREQEVHPLLHCDQRSTLLVRYHRRCGQFQLGKAQPLTGHYAHCSICNYLHSMMLILQNADVILTDLASAIKQIFPTVPLKYIIRKVSNGSN